MPASTTSPDLDSTLTAGQTLPEMGLVDMRLFPVQSSITSVALQSCSFIPDPAELKHLTRQAVLFVLI